jgi:hypothetical protein
MTRAEFDSAVSAMTASSAWTSGTEAQRDALAMALFESFDDVWEQVGDWWGNLWNQFKDWIVPPKSSQHPVSEWFDQWWASMFPPIGFPWSVPPGDGPG